MVANSQSAIWLRLIRPERGDLAPEAAHSILRLQFSPGDEERIAELVMKAQQGDLSAAEEAEAQEYAKAADVLSLFHSKARRSLQDAQQKQT